MDKRLDIAENFLRDALKDLPGATIVKTAHELAAKGRRVDGSFVLTYKEQQKIILVELALNGHPRLLRLAAMDLKDILLRDYPNLDPYPVVFAPYVSAEGRKVCTKEGVGFIDAAGNCYLAFGSIMIDRTGRKNLAPSSRPIKSIFSPKSSRIARALLSDVSRRWHLQTIAAEAKVSLGLASNIMARMLDQEFIFRKGREFILASPRTLLDCWVENYTYKRNKLREFYSLQEPTETEGKIAAYCRQLNVNYALALFSAASRVAPHVRIDKSFIFIDADLDKVGKDLKLKPAPSGANVMLLNPYDEGVFFYDNVVDDLRVVSHVQIYLDLKTYKGRGEEAADFLLSTKLAPQWHRI